MDDPKGQNAVVFKSILISGLLLRSLLPMRQGQGGHRRRRPLRHPQRLPRRLLIKVQRRFGDLLSAAKISQIREKETV